MRSNTQAKPKTPGPHELSFAGTTVWLSTGGALYWPDEGLLVVSDLHFEKGSSYAAAGQMLPPYDTRATLTHVEKLMDHHTPQTVISLGDSFHDGRAAARLSGEDADRIRALTSRCDWLWVEGNHDPDPPQHLGGRAAPEVRLGSLVFRHEPCGEVGEVAGHLHPAVKVRASGRSVRRRCFVSDGKCLVMPALGAFTGGLNVCDEAFLALFGRSWTAYALGADRIYTIEATRCEPDGMRAAGAGWRL